MRLTSFLLFLWSLVFSIPVFAAEDQVSASHGAALFGSPKYDEEFKNFDYVNPEAPKGGELRLGVSGTFDNLNPFILTGVAASGASGVFETLMQSSLDEPFSQYGWVAESVTIAPDRSWVSYQLRPQARFHDGKLITPDDVLFSFDTLREKGHPFYRSYYKDVVKAEKIGARGIKFIFKTKDNRELPMIMGQLPILPKHFWEGKTFNATTLTPLLGSGPYEVEEVVPGRSITYKRVKNWWGKDIPVNKGLYNFDRIRYDYYRDETVLLEAFLSGRFDYRYENIAKNWATGYNSPAVRQNLIVKTEIKNGLPIGMQGFIFNTRREIFKDKRVREALSYAFDFEWANKNMAYGSYKRTNSYFANSELAAEGLPSDDELKILKAYKGRIPDEIFTTSFQIPTTDGSGDARENLLKANELLRSAGWIPVNGKLINAKGQSFKFEIVGDSPAFERWIQPFLRNLERLGIEARFRIVDSSQYQYLKDNFDFDVTVHIFAASLSPGNELRDLWSSNKADQKGSKNLIGVRDPVVDEIVEKIIYAQDRDSIVTLCHALDRLLLWGHYVIPHWYGGSWRIAYWDKFGHPEVTPKYGLTFPEAWWIDVEKNRKIESSQKRNR